MNARCLSSVVALCLIATHPALAASDTDLAQRCISGLTTTNSNGSELTFQPGGTLEGSVKQGDTPINIKGTWTVQNSQLQYHVEASNGQTNDGFIPVRMDDAGNCFITLAGSEQAIHK